MEWVLVLNGDNTDLELLSKYFNSKDLNIIKENSQFIIRSSYLKTNNINSKNECVDINMAKKLVNTVNGLSKVLLKTKNKIRSNSAKLLDQNKKFLNGCTWIECYVNVKNNNFILDKNCKIKFSRNLNKYVEKILNNENYYRAIIFLQYDNDNWRDLYCIYDVISDVVGKGNKHSGKKIIKSWLINKEKSMVNSFTQTVNSIEAIKEKARHGKVISAPKIKISLSDATELIYKILLIWLEKY